MGHSMCSCHSRANRTRAPAKSGNFIALPMYDWWNSCAAGVPRDRSTRFTACLRMANPLPGRTVIYATVVFAQVRRDVVSVLTADDLDRSVDTPTKAKSNSHPRRWEHAGSSPEQSQIKIPAVRPGSAGSNLQTLTLGKECPAGATCVVSGEPSVETSQHWIVASSRDAADRRRGGSQRNASHLCGCTIVWGRLGGPCPH